VDIYNEYKGLDFTVLAFPCNQFGKQEPGTNEQIKDFARNKYHAEFPIMDKVDVNGANACEVYKFLRQKLSGTLGSSIKWNFTKFLCNRQGLPVKRYGPPTKPAEIVPDIVKLLENNS